MNNTAPLLIEIGVEEIPAFLAPNMGENLEIEIDKLLKSANINISGFNRGVTPRRLLIHIDACPTRQDDREETIWGPPERVACDEKGHPTKAAEGFAKKYGIALEAFELADRGDGKGRYLKAVRAVKGRPVVDILAEAMPDILRKLPSPKQMKWNDDKNRDDTFIRPIRWIVACLGDEVIPFEYAGVKSDKISYGHRVHGKSGEIDVNDPFGWLKKQSVYADRNIRKTLIATQLEEAAANAGVELREDDELLDEVTDLVEWPQVISARYNDIYLQLPKEVSRIELKHHQRCFSSHNTDEVSNVFFTIANIASKDPAAVAHGNERVVNARLADAMFYFKRDPKESLDDRVEKLSEIIFQDGLGMVGDQVRRLRGFVLDNAKALDVDANDAQRAAYLCKSDLTTGLVGEFPELQGYMGGIYARMEGENDAVVTGIEHHYAPIGADDALPPNRISRAIGIAERIDKLLGYFHLGKIPTASADPFGLRRAAIGLVRLLSNTTYPVAMTLDKVIYEAAKQWNQQRVTIAISDQTKQQVRDFIIERLLGMTETLHFSRTAIDAAVNSSENRPLYQEGLIARYLIGFEQSPEGQAIAAANKRIANILKKAESVPDRVDVPLLSEIAEKALHDKLVEAETDFFRIVSEGEFELAISPALEVLAQLRGSVDYFFDNVMVMVEDERIRANRLALLSRLRALFLNLADFSRL
jgi:glycyl-tRNA synthetase beta chain